MPKKKKVYEEEQEELKDFDWNEDESNEVSEESEIINEDSEDIPEEIAETESEESEVEGESFDDIEISQPTKKKNKFNNHRLKYDSIFKGKKHDTNSDEFNQDFLVPKQSTFELIDYHSSEDNYRLGQLDEIIYQFVIDKTNIDISAPRRKPGRVEFNKHMHALTEYVDTTLYSYADIFCIFSGYFSDNLFSMFKLLDKKFGAIVAKELKINSNNSSFDDLEIV